MTLWDRLLVRRTSRPAGLPDRMRVYAVGDIHGRADLLREMHREIAAHAESAGPADNHIVYLGDYVDRGMQVKEAVSILAAGPPAGFTPVCLKGNHEEMLLDFLGDARILDDWMSIGGRATLMSYGVGISSQAPEPAQAEQIRRDFRDALPKAHLDFFAGLRMFFQAGDHLFVHAGIRPGIPLEKQKPNDLTSIRKPFLSTRKKLNYRVVHGHNITQRPEILPSRIGVDTGAYATGRLSCVMLEGRRVEHLTIQADGNGYAAV